MKKILITSFAILVAGLIVLSGQFIFDGAAPVLAAGTGAIPDSFNVNEYLKHKDQTSFVPTSATPTDSAPKGAIGVLIHAIDLLTKFIGVVALVVFVIGALLTIVSEGKEDLLTKGKDAMVYSLIGLALAFFSFIIVTFVQSIFF